MSDILEAAGGKVEFVIPDIAHMTSLNIVDRQIHQHPFQNKASGNPLTFEPLSSERLDMF